MGNSQTKTELTTEQLEAKLKSIRVIHMTTVAIFAIIILVWIVLGHWRENLPVFISTVAMAVAISTLQFSSRSCLKSELKRRRQDQGDA